MEKPVSLVKALFIIDPAEGFIVAGTGHDGHSGCEQRHKSGGQPRVECRRDGRRLADHDLVIRARGNVEGGTPRIIEVEPPATHVVAAVEAGIAGYVRSCLDTEDRGQVNAQEVSDESDRVAADGRYGDVEVLVEFVVIELSIEGGSAGSRILVHGSEGHLGVYRDGA